MTATEAKMRIEEESDFIFLKRYDYSLNKLLERYPEGCPDRIIASALMMSEEDIQEAYEQIVVKLRNAMGITLQE